MGLATETSQHDLNHVYHQQNEIITPIGNHDITMCSERSNMVAATKRSESSMLNEVSASVESRSISKSWPAISNTSTDLWSGQLITKNRNKQKDWEQVLKWQFLGGKGGRGVLFLYIQI